MGAITSFHRHGLTFISSFPTLCDDRAANRRARAAYERAMTLAAERGWGQYRAHAGFMDLAMLAYKFNDQALARVQKTQRIRTEFSLWAAMGSGRNSCAKMGK
jgi:hypothetical protein